MDPNVEDTTNTTNVEDTTNITTNADCIPLTGGSKVEQTLALLKPDAYDKADHIINIIRREGFIILQARRVVLTPEQGSEFYRDRYEEEWFQDSVAHITSGPVLALCLSGPSAIEHWRRIMGPPSFEQRIKYPQCLRQQFGMPGSDIKNGVHGSANESHALRELKFFFPQLIIEPVLADNLTTYYLNQHVHPVLTVGLSKLVRERPEDPLLWLADCWPGRESIVDSNSQVFTWEIDYSRQQISIPELGESLLSTEETQAFPWAVDYSLSL